MTTARGVHARPLAEFVFMALLAHWRGLAHLQAEQRAHRWERYCADEVAGKTLVIVGLVTWRAAPPRWRKRWKCASSPSPATLPGRASTATFSTRSFPSRPCMRRSARADALLLTVPHTPQTERMIDAAALAALKPGAAFVNIARGQVVDEER